MSGTIQAGLGGRITHRSTRRGGRALLVAALAMMSTVITVAPAADPVGAVTDQFVFFDASLAHGSPTYAQPSTTSPANWVSPVNYAGGRMFVRLDVTERPSTKPIDVQICIWRNGFAEETCSPVKRLVTAGVQWIDYGKPSSWWKMDGIWEWTTPFTTTRLMLKDAATGKLMLSTSCGAACYVGSDLASHIPIEFDATAIVVAPGATLSAPPEWLGCPTAWSASCAGPVNVAPNVSAGPDRTAVIDSPITLNGSVTDDGLPTTGSLTANWSKVSGPGSVTFGSSTSAVSTATFTAPGAYTLRLTGQDGALTSRDDVVVTAGVDIPPATANSAALIVGKYPLTSSDILLSDRLETLGYAARAFDDNTVSPAVLAQFDVVVVAPSVSATAIPTALTDLAVPILNMKAAASTRLGVGTNGSDQTSQTSIDIVDPSHPLASGLTGRVTIASTTSFGKSTPAPGASVVATIANKPTSKTIYVLDDGATLNSDAPSPERRAVFQLGATAPVRLTATGWSVFDSSVQWLDVLEDPPDPTAWQFPSLPRRVPITVDHGGVTRVDATTELTLEGDVSGTFDPATIRVVEVDAGGGVIDGGVVAQFDPEPGFDGDTVRSGSLVVHLEGTTTTQRHYHAYYGSVGDTPPPAPTPEPLVALTTGVVDQGHPSLRIDTPDAEWFYHTDGGGFSSLNDANGLDWLGWNATTGSAGTFRGTPNLGHPGAFLHPGSTNATTTVISTGPLRARFETLTDDGAFRVRWDVYSDHARMTVLTATRSYWMLYEGLPGGQIDTTTDKVIRADGTTTNLSTAWTGDVPGEWVAFADTVRTRSLYVAQLDDDAIVDSYRLMENNMTVFGFGRNGTTSLLSGPTEFVMGLVDTVTHPDIANAVTAAREPALATPGASVGQPG